LSKNTKPIAQMTLDERREYKAAREKERRARLKEEATDAAKPQPMYAAAVRANEKAAKEFLRDAGIQNSHVMDTIWDLSSINKVPVETLKIDSSWTNELVEGEIIYRADLEALRQFSCPNRSEGEFRDFRYRCKTDHFFLGNDALERPNTFCESCHRSWVEEIFFKKTPTLKPGYTQDDIAGWFNTITAGIPNRSLLMCSRNSRKSTVQIVDNVQFLLNVPDVRVMQISAVKDLAKKFTKFFRFYWTIQDPHKRTLFAQLFPEFMIYADEKSDSNTFFCPMAHLGLGANCVATSMDSSQTGSRFDVGVFDDCADEENENTAALRVGLVEKYDSINKLRAEYGVTLTIGTPQSADQSLDQGDLYAVILGRSEKSEHRYLRYRIDPAWTLKEDHVGTSPYEVVEHPEMIERLLFPEKLSIEFLAEELNGPSGSEKGFRRQYLLEWTDAVAEVERLQFERSVLTGCTVDNSVAPQIGPVYGSGDFGFTLGPRRDPSAFSIFRVPNDNKIFVLEQVNGRWKDSEKAETIVDLTQKYGIQQWFFEAFPNHERLAEDIRKLAMFRGVTLNMYWDPVKNTKNRKFYNLKSLEIPIARGRINFVFNIPGTPSSWIDTLFDQMEKLDGTTAERRSSSVKDDLTESLSLGAKFFPDIRDDESAVEAQEAKEAREKEARRQEQYDVIFGGSSKWHVGVPTQNQEEPGECPMSSQSNSLHVALTRGGLLNQPSKVYSFGDLTKKKVRLDQ
jgi:hypothetical protein